MRSSIKLGPKVTLSLILLTVSQSSDIYIGLTNIAPSTSTPPQYSNYDLCARGPFTTTLKDIYMVQCATNLPASRYAVLQNDGSDHLTFCEVEVYGYFGEYTFFIRLFIYLGVPW
jgi:hypothetical protein